MPALIIVGIVLIVAVLACAPLAVIWAVNTLFGLSIAWTFKNYVAATILVGIFGYNHSSSTRKETK